MNSRTRNSAAFSLVEMLTALAIFSLAVVGTMEVFTTSVRSTSASLGYTNAALLGRKVMEETVAEGSYMEWEDSGDFGVEHPQYTWALSVTETENPGLYLMEVTVAWVDRSREKEYALATLVADRESSFTYVESAEPEEGRSR